MKNPVQPMNEFAPIRTSLARAAWRHASVLLLLSFGCALLPTARAVDPPPDGGYYGSNTAEGDDALLSLTDGIGNTAIGYQALISVTSGNTNTATGGQALANTTSSNNTADGFEALRNDTTGSNNTAQGYFALAGNTSGSSNIALGSNAGINLTTGSNNIAIGHAGVAGESGIIRIGTAGIQTTAVVAGVTNSTIATGVPVMVSRQGRLGVMTSSGRFKDAIKPMDSASEAILALQPVTFHYKHELDPEGIPQFGLVAEQVAKVDPDLVARDDEGKPYTVRYEAVNAMLLNEFLKEHRKVSDQSDQLSELKAEVAELRSALKDQAAQIRKVSVSNEK